MQVNRSGRGINLQLQGEGAWPELNGRADVEWAMDISIAVIEKGTAAGRAAVLVRFDTPEGHVVIGQMTLRELSGAHRSIVAVYGEDFMKQGGGDAESHRKDLAIAELARQLIEAKIRLGEAPFIDMEAADAAYDLEQQQAKTGEEK